MRPQLSSLICLTFGFLVTCGGCFFGGGTGQVEGVVRVDGQPLGGFEVTFTSVADGASIIGFAKAGGEFQLFAGRGNQQIPVGDYKVTLAPSPFIDGVPAAQVKLPAAYTNPDEATLIQTVAPGQNRLTLDVSSK